MKSLKSINNEIYFVIDGNLKYYQTIKQSKLVKWFNKKLKLNKHYLHITNLKPRIAIHCITEENAKKVCSIFNRYKLEMKDGGFTGNIFWKMYKGYTCYSPFFGTIGNILWYTNENYKLILDTDFINANLTVKEKILLKLNNFIIKCKYIYETQKNQRK